MTPERYQQRLADNRARWHTKKTDYWKTQKAWRDANPEHERKRYQKNPGRRMFELVRSRAKAANQEFDLDCADIVARVAAGRCEMTGIQFVVRFGTRKNKNFYNPSIDRIDSTRGYTRDNVRIVLYGLNVMMNTWGAEKIHEISNALKQHAAGTN